MLSEMPIFMDASCAIGRSVSGCRTLVKGLEHDTPFRVLIPSTNTTVEIEYNRLLPPTLQAHVGRLLTSGGGPFSPSQDSDIDYQARLLGTAKVEVVSLAQTSASL